jgi:hypothetical protein
MERGCLADRAVDQLGILGRAEREDVGFDGPQEFRGGIRELAEDRLRADDHDVRSAGDGDRRADDVLKLRSVHGGRAA